MNQTLYQLLDVASFILKYIPLFLLDKLFRKYSVLSNGIFDRKTAIYALYCPASFLILLDLANPENPFSEIVFLPIFALLLIINLPIIYYLYAIIVQNYEDTLSLNKALTETKAQLTRFRYTLLLQEQLKKERHELKNKYFYMQTLLQEQKYDQLQHYLLEVTGNTLEQLRQIETGNTLMDYILNTKLEKCHKNNIKTYTDVLIPSNLPVNEEYLCTILLNLLDNAIEASQKESEPDIHITIKCVQNYLVCKIGNKVSQDILSINPSLETSKKDKSQHGLGLKIITDTIKKCDGTYERHMEDNYFTSNIMIPLSMQAKEMSQTVKLPGS